jgi:NADH dehydrogenase [ubiquinone] 1 alpha subcomplex assembly factor 6
MLKVMTDILTGPKVAQHLLHSNQVITRPGRNSEDYDISPGVRSGESPLDEVNRAFGVFLPAVGTRLWLDRLEKHDFDVFSPELLRSDWRLPWKAYSAYRRKSLE